MMAVITVTLALFAFRLSDAAAIKLESPLDVTVTPEPPFANYAPVQVECPVDQQWIRSADSGLSDAETVYVLGRQRQALLGLQDYLAQLNLVDFDTAGYLQRLGENHEAIPVTGLAISGGAWASGLTGVSILRAFDARFKPSKKERTGGILQILTYLSGLSGGSWPVMSLTTNNFPEIDDMVSSWTVNISHIVGDGNSTSPHAATAVELLEEVIPKFNAGYNVSYAEVFGRSFGYQFLPGPHGGISQSLSNIPSLSAFRDFEMPFPIWQAGAGEANDQTYFNISVPFNNATIYEMNPLEFGAWNGPRSFFPMRYLGTKMVDGAPVQDCTIGFDRSSFILALAADAVNFWILEPESNNTLASFSKRHVNSKRGYTPIPNGSLIEFLGDLKDVFKQLFGYDYPEAVEATLPNPFALGNSTQQTIGRPTNLTLLDESEMLQSLPLWSLIQPARRADFLIAWDNDQDAHPYLWMNGTNIWGTYLYAQQNNIPFPIIPKPATFVNLELSSKPTFFGCDAHLTTTNDTQAPIILYLGNAPYSSYTNYSGFQQTYTNEEMAAIMTNGFNLVTQGNGTFDAEWPECLGCAVVDRSLARTGMQRTEQCRGCFERYCWNGTVDDADPGIVDLPLRLDPGWTYARWNDSAVGYWPETQVRNQTV